MLSQLLDAPMGVERFLRLAIDITAAVGKMHQRGLVHKDIKPANILVNSRDGEIRLTGFGIASRVPRERQPPGPPQFIAGTLAYMAPEQTGQDESIDRFAQRSLCVGCHLLPDADGKPALQRCRRDGMDPLPHCEAR